MSDSANSDELATGVGVNRLLSKTSGCSIDSVRPVAGFLVGFLPISNSIIV